MKKHWYKPGFWTWWWEHRAPDRLRIALAVGVCVVAGVAGYLVAGRLAPAHARTVTSVKVHTAVVVHTLTVTVTGATVRRTLTVREPGPVVRRTVPVVHRVVVPPKIAYVTNTVFLTHNVTVPVTKTVTVSGRSRTVVKTQLVPTVVTHTNVVTQTNVVTHQATQTVVQILAQ
jgi:hypothetical protein